MIIEDGTGKGFFGQVTSTNALRTQGVNLTAFDEATKNGEAFNINTLLQNVTADTALLRVTNNETNSIVIVGWFIGSVSLAGGQPILAVYGGVTGFTPAAETAVPVVNRNVGSARTFAVEAFRPTGTAALAGAAASPVLYQTQSATGRAFGTVFITVPRGGSVGVELSGFGGAITGGDIYTGFTGYVVGNEFA